MLNNNEDVGTVFERKTEEPCPICMELLVRQEVLREWVMPLPLAGPLAIDGRKCCFDCQAAETLQRVTGLRIDFYAARNVIGNERAESLRLPQGYAEVMGVTKDGIMRPAHQGQLKAHYEWLEEVLPLPEGIEI